MTVDPQSKTAAKKPHRAKPRKPRLPLARVPGTLVKPDLASELRSRLQLSQPVFAKLLPVSVRTLVTLESGTPPTEVVSRRLMELKRLTSALTEVLKKETLGRWLQTPNPAFDGLKPLEVIDRGESDRIWSMIYFLRSGVPS
jgi:DNA-binding transcriptional regulator YiaG